MSEISRTRRRVRRATFGAFYAAVGSFCVVACLQVVVQVFGRGEAEAEPDCREALGTLYAAVDRAREAASRAELGEAGPSALETFRAVADPAFADLGLTRAHCAGEPELRAGLDALEQLRYAEEHAVRLGEGRLLALRRRTKALVDRTASGSEPTPVPMDPESRPTDPESPTPTAPRSTDD